MSSVNPNPRFQSSDLHKKHQSNQPTKRKKTQDHSIEESEEEDENNDDEWFSESSNSENEDEREPRLIMYAAYTQYDVVKEVAKTLYNFHLTKNDQREFDIAWFDGPISIKLLQRMWPHQRTNHFPGMYNLARKNCLGRHLTRMQKWFPEDYDFFPQTFMLPIDYKEFKAQITAKRNKTFIVKPEASCQGKGIFLTRNYEDIEQGEHYVVQRYMHKPYLVDGYKFDLRLYVMLVGVNPLRIYMYQEGLARFATIQYESPQPSNLSNLFMHLTNYAINKESEFFVQNLNENEDDVGSKRSFSSILKRIKEEFGEEKTLKVQTDIKDLIIKTLCIAQPHLQHLYHSSQPDDVENQMCYQILGFDIMLDNQLKPQLLEVNQSPSFSTDSPLDYKIKKQLITDTISLLNLSIKRKLKAKGMKRAEMQKRLFKTNGSSNPLNEKKDENQVNKKVLTSAKATQPISNSNPVITKGPQKQVKTTQQLSKEKMPEKLVLNKIQKKEEKEEMRKKKMLQRERQEKELKGNYQLIYPLVSYEEEFKQLEQEKQDNQSKSLSSRKAVQDTEEEEEKDKEESGKEETQWEKQQKYMKFMEKAKELWESFTNGNAIQKKLRKKEEELKLKDEEREKRIKLQKQKLLERMRKQNEERERKQQEYRQSTYRKRNGLDEEGNLLQTYDQNIEQFQSKRKSSADNLSPKHLDIHYGEMTLAQKMLSPSNQRPPQYYYDNRHNQNQNEFYLPLVEQKRYLNNPVIQSSQKTVLESYERKYQMISKNYSEICNQAVPAVPALTNGGKPPLSPDQKQKERNLSKNDSWTRLNKPPINKSQLVQIKSQDSDQNSSFMKQRIAQQAQHKYLVDTKQQSTQKTPAPQRTFGPFEESKPSNPNDARIGGINHYNINNGIIDFTRKSQSQDRRAEKKQSQKQSQITQLPISINYQNPIILSLNAKQIQIKKRSNQNQPTTDILNMGIIGEKKQLQGIDFRNLENISKIPIKKPQRMLKIKEKSMKIDSSELIQSLSNAMHHSSSYKNNLSIKELTKN